MTKVQNNISYYGLKCLCFLEPRGPSWDMGTLAYYFWNPEKYILHYIIFTINMKNLFLFFDQGFLLIQNSSNYHKHGKPENENSFIS